MLVFDTLDHRKVGLQFRNAKTKATIYLLHKTILST